MQTRLKVTSKGQVTLRKEVLDHLGVRPGDTIVLNMTAPGKAEVKAAGKHGIERVFGMLKRPGQPVLSIEDMNDIIAKGWAGEG